MRGNSGRKMACHNDNSMHRRRFCLSSILAMGVLKWHSYQANLLSIQEVDLECHDALRCPHSYVFASPV